MASLYSVPTQDFLQKTLDAVLLTGVTASATFNNMTGVQNLPGVFIVDRINTNNVGTPSKREVIAYTATSGVTVTTLTRGLAGTSDQDHAVGAIVEFAADVVWAQAIYDTLSNLVNPATQAVDTTKVVTPTATQTLTNKTLTSPTVNTPTVTSPVINTAITGTAIVDEDDMVSDSATKVPTQQSVKAYVDASAPSLVLDSITQTNLASGFTAAANTSEQEVTGLRVTLPIVSGGTSCTVKVLLKVYWTTVAGDNTLRVRLGTSTSYLTNSEKDNLYVSGAKTLETFTGVVVVTGLDLTAQNYVVVSVQNGTNASGMSISAANARSTIVTEVYK